MRQKKNSRLPLANQLKAAYIHFLSAPLSECVCIVWPTIGAIHARTHFCQPLLVHVLMHQTNWQANGEIDPKRNETKSNSKMHLIKSMLFSLLSLARFCCRVIKFTAQKINAHNLLLHKYFTKAYLEKTVVRQLSFGCCKFTKTAIASFVFLLNGFN